MLGLRRLEGFAPRYHELSSSLTLAGRTEFPGDFFVTAASPLAAQSGALQLVCDPARP